MFRHLFLLVLGGLGLAAAPAFGQELVREPIDIERFKPALTHDPFVVTEGTDVRWLPGESRVQLGAAINGSWNPLVVVEDGEIVRQIVSGRAGFDLFGSLSLTKGFALGLGLPLFAAQDGDGDPNPAGVGDLRLVPKIRLVDDATDGIGVALIPEVRLPTHSDEEFSGGARSAVFAPRLAVDHRFPGGFRLGANVGLLAREGTQFRNITAASEFTYSAAAELYPDGYDGIAAIGVDFHGAAGLADLDLEEAPLEGQLYAMIRPEPEVQIHFGPSMGIVAGYGTPTFRLYAGLRWSPKPILKEPCPEYPVAVAPAPSEPRDPRIGVVRVKVLDSTNDQPIARARARVDDVQLEPTGKPGESEADVEPGDHILWVRAKGYVPQRIEIDVPRGGEIDKTVRLDPLLVTVTEERLEFTGTVYFAFDSARLEHESHDLLDEVATVLNAHPELRLIRVEGHADATGPAAYNQGLSERRAASVRGYLISAGVDSERLESQGYGESRPVSKVYSENRRVEFVIVKGRVQGAKIFNVDDR
jgi:OmpA-OmpF porin, OOP family